jgi:hypothetical protein
MEAVNTSETSVLPDYTAQYPRRYSSLYLPPSIFEISPKLLTFILFVFGFIYEGNSKSKVAYFIPAERVPALS